MKKLLYILCVVLSLGTVVTLNAVDYTLTGRATLDGAQTGGLPSGVTISGLTSSDKLIVTADNAQIYFVTTGTINCNIDVRGNAFGTEKTGKIRIQSAGNVINGVVNLLGATVVGSHNSTLGYGVTFNGQITGTGEMIYAAGSGSTVTLANTSTTAVNNYTGNTVLGYSGLYPGDVGMKVVLGASEQIPDAGNLVMNAYSSSQFASLNLNGFNETVNGLVSGGATPEKAVIFNNSGTTSVLTLGANNADSTYSGKIGEGGTNLSIVKVGTGTQTVFGALMTYTGKTTVQSGTLNLYNTGSKKYTYAYGDVTGSGTLKFTGNGLSDSHVDFTGATLYNAAGTTNFTGDIVVDGARFMVNNNSQFGGPSTRITVQNNGQLYLLGSVDADVFIAGNGTNESSGDLGAIRLQNGTLGGTLTLTDDAEISVFHGSGVVNSTIALGAHTLAVNVGYQGPLTLAGKISGEGGLVLNNTIKTYISGDNDFSGGTTIKQGTIYARSDTAFGTGTLTLQGGTLTEESERTFANDIHVTGNATLDTGGERNMNLQGDITGNGTITRKGVYTVMLYGDNSGFTGKWVADGQNTYFRAASAGSASAEWNVIKTLSGAVGGTYAIDLGALTGAGTVRSDSGDLTYNIGGKNVDAEFTGTLQKGSGSSTSINKVGTATQILRGNLTYNGTTTVTEGTLTMKPDGTLSSATTVNGGRLNFEGTLGAPLTVNVGGEFSPGMTTGSATIQNLTLNGDLIMEIASAQQFDSLTIQGTQTYGEDSRIVLDLYRPTGMETLDLQMINTVTDDANWVLGENAYYWQNATFHNGTLNIEANLNAIPEPATWLLLIFGAFGLLCLKKRPRFRPLS